MPCYCYCIVPEVFFDEEKLKKLMFPGTELSSNEKLERLLREIKKIKKVKSIKDKRAIFVPDSIILKVVEE